jgi:eukaryotic-like serine/threonine-protein kinase
MNDPRWSRVEELFDAASELCGDDRERFLGEACGDDRQLHDQVSELLESAEGAEEYLAGLAGRAGALLGEPEAAADPAEGRFGPYRLVRRIGEGGMGAVYLAERSDGQVEMRVAVKMLPPRLDTDLLRRRLLAERQILARLEHPGIARLLDAGVSSDETPYFVMEYVDGEPIDRHCDRLRLDLRARLALFRQVCAAVDFAHRRLVVHRDLKPSNILVTPEGRVKLLDFGIAKALDGEGYGDETELTRAGGRPMTPAYASPEQVRGESVTTATDVYLLGVLLFRLLSGHHPFPRQGLSTAERERRLCETEPEPPSAALLRVGEPPRCGDRRAPAPEFLAAARATTAPRLVRALRGDLDNIVLTALRREPEHRYPSVAALSEDVERYLQGMPVAARPATIGYRASRFVRRNRAGVAAAASIAGLLLALTGVSIHSARASAEQARSVAAERDRAAAETTRAEQITEFLVGLFETADPLRSPETEMSARDLLDRGVQRFDSLTLPVDARAELGVTMARAYRSLGLYDDALRLMDRVVYSERGGTRQALRLAEALRVRGDLLTQTGDFAAAEQLFRRSLEIRREHLGEFHVEVAATLDHLAEALRRSGEYEQAEPLFREALQMRRLLLGDEHPSVATALNNLGLLLIDTGHYDEAERVLRQSLEMRLRLLGDEHPSVVQSLNNLALALRSKGDPWAAEPLARRTLEMRRTLFGDRHPAVARAMNNLGILLRSTAEYGEAESMLRQALELRRDLLGADHPSSIRTQHNLGTLLRYRGEFDEAERLLVDALSLRRTVLGEDHPDVASTLHQLGLLRRDRGETAAAESYLRRSLDLRVRTLGDDHPRAVATREALESLEAIGGG